ALRNVDRVRRIGQSELLERDGNLAAVRRRPGVEIDHGQSFAGDRLRLAGLTGSAAACRACRVLGKTCLTTRAREFRGRPRARGFFADWWRSPGRACCCAR